MRDQGIDFGLAVGAHPTVIKRNPFSTRYVRPGAIAYQFIDKRQSAQRLVDQLARQQWCGQIVGPHGSGKSTLIATLIPLIEAAGRRVVLITLHDGERVLPIDLATLAGDSDCDKLLVIIDGYEQLSAASRRQLKRLCKDRWWGLLATAHASVGLPDLFQSATSVELAERLVRSLAGEGDSPVMREKLIEFFAAHQGNLREMLFALYDLYERNRSRGAS